MLNEYSTWMDVLRFAGSRGDRDWVYIITGRPGPTGKTFLCQKLKQNGYNAFEISEVAAGVLDYKDNKNHYKVDYVNKQLLIVLNKKRIEHTIFVKTPCFETKASADKFIDDMSYILETYGVIYCADVLEYCGENVVPEHDKYGWTSLADWHTYHDYSIENDNKQYKVRMRRPVPISEEKQIKEFAYMDVASLYPKTFSVLPLSQQKLKPKIKDVLFNEPATIVFWTDGTKTIVKTQDGEEFDPEKGLAMAISKKALGNSREYYHTFLHWLKKYEKESALADVLVKRFGESTIGLFTGGEEQAFEQMKTTIKSYNKKSAVQKAYDLAVNFRDTSEVVSINEIIGYLGEALED